MSILRWPEFKAQIEKHIPKERRFSAKAKTGFSRSLFRGHASDKWTLATTLERRIKDEISLHEYMRLCSSARRYMGNYSPSAITFDENIAFTYDDLRVQFPNFEYLAFLRHHGFPSPFLDWTESPYVAAFFALRDAPPSDASAARVYVYISDTGSGRGYCTSSPHILIQGPFASIHERHAMQQCWYTMAVRQEGDDCIISSHHEALNISVGAGQIQDLVTSFDISLKDREEALADLYSMNISAYTLFRSVDTLIETTSHRLLPQK